MSPNHRIVEAEAFVVRDSQGRKRGFFGMEGEEPVLKLCDAEGQARIVLRLTTDVSGGTLSSDPGGAHVGLSLTAGSEGIALFGRDGKTHLIILGMPDGTSFYVYDSKGECKIRLDARELGSAVSLHDGGLRGFFEYRRKEGGSLVLLDETGEQVASLDGKHPAH
jgi:hypothetical protein